MVRFFRREYRPTTGAASVFAVILFGFVLLAVASDSEQPAASPPQIKAYQPGETLTYSATWSNTVKIGTAVMEVKAEKLSDGRDGYRFISTSQTEGAVGALYPLGDVVQSVFDPAITQTVSFSVRETQGKRRRARDLTFDHENRTVTVRKDEDPVKTFTIPDLVQDNLSSIYYLRTRDFAVGKIIAFDVFDSDKTWNIQVQVLDREKVKTQAGEFDTIKVKAYKGFLMSEGEIYIWLTDDIRKIPVIIKSKVKIGSIMFKLTDLKPGATSELHE